MQNKLRTVLSRPLIHGNDHHLFVFPAFNNGSVGAFMAKNGANIEHFTVVFFKTVKLKFKAFVVSYWNLR